MALLVPDIKLLRFKDPNFPQNKIIYLGMILRYGSSKTALLEIIISNIINFSKDI